MSPWPSIPLPAQKIAHAMQAAGGRAWIVGGWVRDTILGRPTGDIDIEVSGVDTAGIQKALRPLGPHRRVGRAFPVIKITIDGFCLDISQPRMDSRPGAITQVDPNLKISESAARRDLRINAIALDPLTGEICDPFEGKNDLKTGRLRAVDKRRFLDDPLRALRVARFAGQLGFHADEELIQLCQTADLTTIASERIGFEIIRLLKSEHVQHGMKTGYTLGIWHQLLPEVSMQPETIEVQALARLTDIAVSLHSPIRTTAVGIGVLLHRTDTKKRNRILDRWDIHKREGLNLRQIVCDGIHQALKLIEDCNTSTIRSSSESGELGVALGIARCIQPSPALEVAVEYATNLGIMHSPLLPLLQGRDLLALGVPAGEYIGTLLNRIRAAQLDGRINTFDDAMKLARQLIANET